MRARGLLTIAFVAVAGAALAADVAMKTVMADAVNPAALAFWAAGNDPPDGETPAQAKVRWAEALKGAKTLEEHGRMLMAAPYARSGRWNEDAKLMVDTAAEGEAAIKAQDAQKAFEIGGRLYDACNGCHKTYVPRRE
jgi:hypothetical protein